MRSNGTIEEHSPAGDFHGEPMDISTEKHYSVSEVAKLWGLSEKAVRRIFEKEPGVIELRNEETRFKRAYVTRRIPESILKRVHRRLQKAA